MIGWRAAGRVCVWRGAIDDATKKVPAALFRPTETTEAYFGMFEKAFRKKGLCHSVYADRHSIFYTDRELTVAEQLAGERKAMTELGRAFDELGITLIPAGSPLAARSKDAVSAWREIPEGVDLKRVLCWKKKRTVARDNTISLKGVTLQLPENKTWQSLAGKVVDVLILRDKTVEVFYKNMRVAAFAGRQLHMAA